MLSLRRNPPRGGIIRPLSRMSSGDRFEAIYSRHHNFVNIYNLYIIYNI